MSATRALDVLRVETPCPQAWDAMTGDGNRVRYCEGCGLHVHNLSAMSPDDAERLVCETAGRLCVRYERTLGGRVRTLEYEPGRPRRGAWRRWTVLGMLGAAAAVFGNALWSPTRQSGAVMGMVPYRAPAPTSPLGPPPPNGTGLGSTSGTCGDVVIGEPAPVVTGPSVTQLGPPAPGQQD